MQYTNTIEILLYIYDRYMYVFTLKYLKNIYIVKRKKYLQKIK